MAVTIEEVITEKDIGAKKAGTEEKKVHIEEKKSFYHIENSALVMENRAARFLNAFASILKHTNYKPLLDMYSRSSTKCARCNVMCPVYQVTGDPKDIPCYRTNLLLDIYKRHFTIGGYFHGRILGNGHLKDKDIDELQESLYRCTACRRCSIECPMGIDHGLITHLGRYILSEIGIVPKALKVSVREQLEGKTGNTS
ncbi:4Fe-4S dicluster domain-containing protein, partial [bacterium]